MKVGVISSSIYRCPPHAYGSEGTTWDVADVLSQRGHEVHLFAPPGSKRPDNGFLHTIPLSHTQVSIAHEGQIPKMYEQVLLDMDFIHDASATCRVTDWLHWRKERGNFIAVRNGIDATFPVCGRNVVGLSAVQREILTTKAIPYRLKSMKYVHYGIDTDTYSPGVRSVLGLSDEVSDSGYFLFLARPHHHKGVDTFIRLAKEHPDEWFVMAWKAHAPDHKEWEQQYLQMAQGINNLIFYEIPDEGHHEHKKNLYALAKALVIPLALDYVEAFGLVFIEALACGTPVITATHGACPEVIDHGRTGFLCRSYEHYCNAIRSITHISRSECRREAVEKYSREQMVDEYEKMYQQVLDGDGWG
tara:strand:+ start:1525 stop:2604 length:1080 start_codon:yes stop_codon:yes gene_type:complete